MAHEGSPDSVKREIEARDIALRGPLIVDVAKRNFNDTALIENKPFREHDVKAVMNFYIDAAPFAHPKLYPDFWRHTLAVSLYAKFLAPHFALDPHELQVDGLLHGVTRIIDPVHYGRTNLLEKPFLRAVGIRLELIDQQSSVFSKLLTDPRPVTAPEQLSDKQKVIVLSDMLGRLLEDGSLITANNVKAADTSGHYTQGIWPSEKALVSLMQKPETQQRQWHIIEECLLRARGEKGIDFEVLRRRVAGLYHNKAGQRWLMDVMDAQETLDPSVDEKLKRPKIRYVVFDAEGMMSQDSGRTVAELVDQQHSRLTLEVARIFRAPSAGDTYTALQILKEKLGVTDMQEILFIDDKEAYTTAARSQGVRAFTFRDNPYTGTTPIQKLKKELTRAALL